MIMFTDTSVVRFMADAASKNSLSGYIKVMHSLYLFFAKEFDLS